MPDPNLSQAMAHTMLTHYPDVDEAALLLADWIEEDRTLDYPAVVEHLRLPGRDLDVDVQAEFGIDFLDCDSFWQLIWMETTMTRIVENSFDYHYRLLRTMVLAITRHGIL